MGNFFREHRVLNRVIRIVCLMVIGLIVAHLFLAERNVYWQDAGFVSMSTWLKVRFYVPDKQAVGPAVRLVQNTCYEISDMCNVFNPESELARLNATAYREPFRCSEKLWEMLTAARKWYKLSGGAFDISIGPLMKLWGFRSMEKHLPSPEEIAAAKKLVGLDKVVFNDADRSVRFTVEGMSLDLGGIAKGASLDLTAARAAETSFAGTERWEDAPFMKRADAWFKRKRARLNRGFIDFGGNVLALPEPPPDGKAYRAGVRNFFSEHGKPCAYISLLDECVSTSASYERYVVLNGRRYSHIIDPVSGRPVEDMLSVTVVAKHGIDADALSTAIFVKGKAFAEQMKKEMPEIKVLMYYSEPGNPEKIHSFTLGDGWEDVTIPVELPEPSAAERSVPVLSPAAPPSAPASSAGESVPSSAPAAPAAPASSAGASGNH